MAGVNVDEIHDSVSLEYLYNQQQPSQRSFQFIERINGDAQEWAISNGEFKLIEIESGQQQLYQLSQDPYENTDFIQSNKAPQKIIEELSNSANFIRTEIELNHTEVLFNKKPH